MSLNQRIFSRLSKNSNSNDDIYQESGSASSSIATILSAVSEKKSLSLFNAIANISKVVSADDRLHHQQQPAISHMNLTRKQYYSRINRLREAGLIHRRGSRFILTSLGKVVAGTHKTIGSAIHNQWKLKAIDSLDASLSAEGMPTEERHKLINALLVDHEVIKDILLCQSPE